MPSLSSMFSRRRRTIYSGTDEEATGNKLKSRSVSRLFSSDARFLSRATVDNVFVTSPSGPAQAPRPVTATPAEPELSDLPIYQNFSAGKRVSLVPEWRLGNGQPSGQRRIPRIATISDFGALGYHQLPSTNPEPQFLTTEKSSEKLTKKESTEELTEKQAEETTKTPAEKPNGALPVYDRSAELGRFYQSILPDFQAICEEDQKTADADGPCPGDQQQWPLQDRQDTRTRISTDDRQPTRPITPLDPSAGHTQNLSFASSSTAVDSIAQSPTPPLDASSRDSTSKDPHDCRLPLLINEHTSAGLQICTILLTDQLRKTLDLPKSDTQKGAINTNDASEDSKDHQAKSEQRRTRKLQVLLLIEAYEELLRGCRAGEVLLSGSGQELGMGLKKGVGVEDAVPILEHWLDSLRGVYDDVFVDGAA